MTQHVPIQDQLTPPGGWLAPERVRLRPLTPKEAPPRTRIFIWVINRIGKLEASNLFMTLIRNGRLFRAWLGFASKLMPYGSIDRRDTELVILRVGWNCRARYEWGQHVDIGLRAGVSAEDIARVARGPEADGWEPRVVALLRACDEFHADRMVSEDTWALLSGHFDRPQLIEVLMLIGHYEMLAGVLNSTGLPLDTRLEGVLASAQIHHQ